jgi:hopanoid C-3 methylase
VNILLLQPAKAPSTIGGDDISIFEPLALEYLAAGLVPDHDVRILDMRLDPDLERVLASFEPEVVGLTGYTVHVNPVKALCERVKAWRPETLTVVGGHHATVWPQDFDSPQVDLVVRGEGIGALREIVSRWEGRRTYEGIAGVCRRIDGRFVVSEPAPIADLDSVPLPARDLTASYRSRYFSEWMRPLASIRTSKGCPHRCNFCAQWKLSGGRYLRRSPESVVAELAGIEEPWVFFADDESLHDTPRMRRLAELIREAGIAKRYFLYARSETIVRAPELIELWRAVGLERVFVGLEFFRQSDLEYVRKGSTVSDNERAIAILKALGIDIYASFIIRPEFTRDDFAAFRRYVRSLKLNFATFSVLTPLPGTDLHTEVADQIVDHDYDHVDFVHTLLPTALPLKEFYAECSRLYERSLPLSSRLSLVRKIPLRDLPGLQATGTRFRRQLRTAYRDRQLP